MLAAYLGNDLRLRVAVVFLLAALWQQADIRVAYGLSRFPLFLTHSHYIRFKQKLLVTGVVYKVDWMLVVLGSIHYCNYTCALSTWSSSTLL